MAGMTEYEGDELLTPQETSQFLKVPVSTLKWWRHRHMGPPYIAFGGSTHIRYRRSDLEGWLEAQTVEAS
jgi:hypothetical protein